MNVPTIRINSEVVMTTNLFYITQYKDRGFYVSHKYNTQIQKHFNTYDQAIAWTQKQKGVAA